jgi:AraC family transcriptional regulator
MTEDSLTSRVASRLNVDAPLLREIGFALRREMSAPKSFSQRFGESLAAGLTIEVIRQFGPENETSRTGPAGLSRGQLRRISSYINENLASAMPLRELAAVLGMSVSRFGRTFKAATGITPHQWILNARLRRAEEMLSDGDLPLSEIAISTGFSEQSNFNRAFRRAVGIAPGVWRRQFQR